MSNYHTILFKSRNKDNKHLEGFKERSKTFLSDKPVEELINKFKQFAEEGIEGELSRFYRSVNSRDIKKANTKLVHYLIDNPELPPHKLQTKLVSLASEKNCAVESKWLFDYDVEDGYGLDRFKEFADDVVMYLPDDHTTTASLTNTGYAVIVRQGFDTRNLLKKWENTSLHRDGMLFIDGKIK